MANLGPATLGDRFILDTAGSTLLKSALAQHLLGTPLDIKGIRWVGATAGGHACIIQDANSIVLWESLAAGSNNVESDLMERVWSLDFKLTTLESGRVYLYLGRGGF